MSPTLRISEHFLSQIHDYADKHLPRMFALPRKFYPMGGKYELQEPQFGYFARLFDAAVRVKRLKIQGIWDKTEILKAKHFAKRAHTYVQEKWPFIQTDPTTLFLDTFVDILCEKLWYDDWPTTKFTFVDRNMWTVFADYVCESEFVELLEEHTFDIERSNMRECYQEDVDEIALFDLSELNDKLDQVGTNWCFYNTIKRVSRTFTEHTCPEVYLEVSDVQFKHMDNTERYVDSNWIEIPKTIIPRILRKTRFSIPMMPLVKDTDERLLELLLPGLLHDEFFLRRPYWHKSIPIFIQDLDCYYFNSSYYGFDRQRMLIYFSDVIHN
jgi:hypothetical protein